ncbi:Calcineurin-like phosphoesterase superfamily domain protein [compost metagenome]
MDTWFTSDLHFFHKNIIKYCDRPWSFEDQTEELIARWNSRVGVMDDVYHLGDFAFAGFKKLNAVVDIINRLNGNIHFIRGNHCEDRLWQAIADRNIAHVEWIKDFAEIRVEGQKLILCHYPLEVWNGSHHGSWHLHGHCHGSLPSVGKRLDVGLDNHPEKTVFSFQEIREYMAGQVIAIKDHHEGDR